MPELRGANARWGHVITAMATPLDDEGRILPQRAAELAQYLLRNGSDAVVVNGTTGESPTTTIAEKVTLVRAVADAIGSNKVIAGAGTNNTAEAVELARRSRDAGAGALLTVTPYYNKPSQEGLYRHFRAVAEAAPDLPVILYNVPGRTITNIDAVTTARLARDVANIVATKEASGNMAQVAEIARTTPDDFDIYSGDDATMLPTLALGGAGVISVISHVCGPDIAALHQAWFSGDVTEALSRFLRILPLSRALFAAPSPAPTKYALGLLGEPVGGVRLPLVELSDCEGETLRGALREFGLSV